MENDSYKTANSWYSSMHGKGFKVPINLCQTIEKMMKKDKNLTFAEAYADLEKRGLILVKDKEVIYKEQ